MDRPCGAENARRIKTPSPSLSVEKTDIQSCTAERGGVPIPEVLMGFTKLDEGILQSSIMAESSDVFKAWIALLAACGPDGIARVSAVFISSVCRLSLEVIHAALEKLEAPDPDSRSEEEEGRRIRRVDGGWFIINYKKYRAFKYSEEPEAVRKRQYRKKRKRDMSGTCPGHSASASASLKVIFDFSSLKWEGIKEDDLSNWAEAFPAVDVKQELLKMREWIKANPQKGRKSNYRRFITNWLRKEQDRGGTRRGLPSDPAPGAWLKMMKEKEGKK
jgi:hypothetical protein